MFPGYTGKDLTVDHGVSLGEEDHCGPAGSTSPEDTPGKKEHFFRNMGIYETCFAVLVGESWNWAQWLLLGPVFLKGSSKAGKTTQN